MDKPFFQFEMNATALQYICRAMDKYVEKWPGGHPEEQETQRNTVRVYIKL